MRRTWERRVPGASSPDEGTHKSNRHSSFLSWPPHTPHQHPETQKHLPQHLKEDKVTLWPPPRVEGWGLRLPVDDMSSRDWQVGAGGL